MKLGDYIVGYLENTECIHFVFKVKFIYLQGELYISGKYIEVKYYLIFLKQDLQIFSLEGQAGFVCYMISIKLLFYQSSHRHYELNANGGICVSVKLYTLKHVVGQIWFMDHSFCSKGLSKI